MIKQISVFLENAKGTLYQACRILGDNGIDLIALSIADTADYGIMRCIVSDPDTAMKLLVDNGFAASTAEVLAVEVSDKPGGLADVLKLLDEKNINLEYIYSFIRHASRDALIVLRVEDNRACVDVLAANGIRVLQAEEIYAIA